MLGQALVFFFENVVFWFFVYIIVFMRCETPVIVYSGFGLFLFYWIFRFLFSKKGWELIIWMYVFNMIVTICLLYYFMTGMGPNRAVRSFLNSISRNVPSLEPYLKRC